MANHWRREALPGKEGDVGKWRYQQRRELGGPGKERERADREKGPGKRGVVMERNARGVVREERGGVTA